MASTVTLQYGALTERTTLVDGKVHIPTVKEAFELRVAKINGVLEPADSQGFTHVKFSSGDTLSISGTPAEAIPGTLQSCVHHSWTLTVMGCSRKPCKTTCHQRSRLLTAQHSKQALNSPGKISIEV